MRVSIVTSHFTQLPPEGFGAVEKLYMQLAYEWKSLGYDVEFYSVGGGAGSPFEVHYIKGFKRSANNILGTLKDIVYSLRVMWHLRKTDILLANTIMLPVVAPFFKWKYKRMVYGVHRCPRKHYLLYSRVDVFACVSTAMRNELISRFPCYAEKAFVVFNPVDLRIFRPLDEGAVKSDVEERSARALDVLYTGRIHPEKGCALLAKVVSCISQGGQDLELSFVGGYTVADGGGGEKYKELISSEFPKSHFEGPIRESGKLAERIQKCDIYVYPTLAEKGEAFGVAPLEAMACGKAVVMPCFPCFDDYALHNVNCIQYLAHGDVEGNLRNAILKLIESSELRDRLGRCAQKTAQGFSPRIIAEHYAKLFEGVGR